MPSIRINPRKISLTQAMILQDIQAYLRQRSTTSLAELAQHFHVEADALRAMLDRLVAKGRVRKLATKTCSGCHSCNPTSLELYEIASPR